MSTTGQGAFAHQKPVSFDRSVTQGFVANTRSPVLSPWAIPQIQANQAPANASWSDFQLPLPPRCIDPFGIFCHPEETYDPSRRNLPSQQQAPTTPEGRSQDDFQAPSAALTVSTGELVFGSAILVFAAWAAMQIGRS